jgi:biotin carboxyl carrier protein
MRYYLIDSESNEHILDLKAAKIHSTELVEFHFSNLQEEVSKREKKIFIRKLAGRYFSSEDGISWSKLAKQFSPTIMLNSNQVMDLYRGFKPSGLSGDADGELKTQMPGKVIKVAVKVGDEIIKGTPVIILEAMKMENEIKTPVDGKVKAIHVKEGEVVEQGILILELE